MRRWFVGLVAALLAGLVVTAARADDDVWHGTSLLAGGKGYVAAPMGQLHYRDIGPRNTAVPFLLLHQTPWSMVEFAAIQNEIAARGYRVITVDTPGYGLSDAPPTQPTIATYADNLVALLDALNIRKVIVGGHHTGASIAAALAARHPDRIAGVILHGVPLYTAAEREDRLATPGVDRTLKPDGSHLSNIFHWLYELTNDPAEGTFNNSRNATWGVLLMYLQDKDIGHVAAFSYDLEPDLKKIAAPTLVLSDKQDSLNAIDQKAAKLRPNFSYREFSQGHMLALMNEPKHWADIAVEFAATKVSAPK